MFPNTFTNQYQAQPQYQAPPQYQAQAPYVVQPQQTPQAQYPTNQFPPEVEYVPCQTVRVLNYQDLPSTPISQEQLSGLAQQIELQFMQGRKAWQANFEAITYLRTINKQYPIFVNQLFEKFGTKLLEFIDEVKPFILRNTIYLLTEVVRNGAQVPLHENILKFFVPKIALKSQMAESKIIREDCLVCMSEFVLNCLGDTSIMVVLTLCSDKHPQLQIFALRMLAKQLESLGEAFKMLQQDTLQFLILTLSCSLESKRLDVQNFGYQIFMFIYNLVGQDPFLHLVSVFLNPQQKEELIKILQQKNEKFNKRADKGNKVSARKSMVQKNKENNHTDPKQFIPQFAVGQSASKVQYWTDGNQAPYYNMYN